MTDKKRKRQVARLSRLGRNKKYPTSGVRGKAKSRR